MSMASIIDGKIISAALRASVPTLVVDDRYRVSMDVGRKTALAVVDHLIASELGEPPAGE
jgi:hypothetical protein